MSDTPTPPPLGYVVRITAMLSPLNQYENLVIGAVLSVSRCTVKGTPEEIRKALEERIESRRKRDFPRCKPVTVTLGRLRMRLVPDSKYESAHIEFNDRRGTFLAIELLPVTDPITL